MRIESLKLKSSRNSNIFIVTAEGEEFVFHCDAIVKFGISSNSEIDTATFNKAREESDYIICLNTANNYLGANLKTRKQLKDYLVKKSFDKKIIDKVLNKLDEYGVINDKTFANAFISSNQNKFSKRVMQQKLISKGIKKEEFEENLTEFNDRELCVNFATKFMKNKIMDDKTKEKLIRHLQYKGFNFDDIVYALNKLKINIEEN